MCDAVGVENKKERMLRCWWNKNKTNKWWKHEQIRKNEEEAEWASIQVVFANSVKIYSTLSEKGNLYIIATKLFHCRLNQL